MKQQRPQCRQEHLVRNGAIEKVPMQAITIHRDWGSIEGHRVGKGIWSRMRSMVDERVGIRNMWDRCVNPSTGTSHALSVHCCLQHASVWKTIGLTTEAGLCLWHKHTSRAWHTLGPCNTLK
eukprot:scaffold158372_cov27-Tisochrysis_lutea.AAC.2